MVEALNCPNCGAPLQFGAHQTRAVCLYCNATVRSGVEPSGPAAQVESILAETDMTQIKQLLLDGQMERAVTLYCLKSGTSREQASELLASLANRLSLNVVRHQQLTLNGIVQVSVYVLILLVGVWVWAAGNLHWLIGLALVGFATWMLYYYYPAVLTTLAFRRGQPAKARVLKLVPVGIARLRGTRAHVFNLWVEIVPDNGTEPFKAEMLLPVRAENVARAQPDTILRVKYLPEQPNKIVYDE